MRARDILELTNMDTTVAIKYQNENGFHSPSEKDENREIVNIDVSNDIIVLQI